jgi:hypothetical protein
MTTDIYTIQALVHYMLGGPKTAAIGGPMYDYLAVRSGLDAHWPTIAPCIAGAVVFSFVYFTTAVRQAIREKVYVEAFLGATVFFWHDFSYVLNYQMWFHEYRHWWFEGWWFALIGTTGFEAFLIYQVFQYGHQELWPSLSRRAFGTLIVLGTLAVGTMWFLLKGAIEDRQYLITFAITAIWSAPFHTALMCMRKNRAGQAVVRELCMAANLILLTIAFAQLAPRYFLSPTYLAFFAAFVAWPLANVWLILHLPPHIPGTEPSPSRRPATMAAQGSG